MLFADSAAPRNTRELPHRAGSQSYQQHHKNKFKDVELQMNAIKSFETKFNTCSGISGHKLAEF